MQRSGTTGVSASERVYSVVFRTNADGGRFEILNIVGERKTPAEIARDLLAAAKEIEDKEGRGRG